MTLSVTEFRSARNARSALEPIAIIPPLAEQTVAVGAASVQSSALNATTDMVRLLATESCSVSFGVNPVATAINMRLAAGLPEYFSVPANISLKIAVIASS